MGEQANTEQIERYLLGQMDDAEKAAFDQQLQTDPALRQEVDLQQTLTQHVRKVGREDFRKRLKALHRTLNEAPTDPMVVPLPDTNSGKFIPLQPRFAFWQYAMAASVVLVLGVSIYLFRQTDQPSPNKPQRALIPFAPTGEPRTFGIANAEADSTAPVLIYSATKPETMSYRFDDTLRLYGQFDISQLRLVYKPAPKTYSLEVGTQTYALKRYGSVEPLQTK